MQSTLSGLRSLCAIPCLCRCFKAPAKSFTILLASASVKQTRLWMWSRRGPPSIFSKTSLLHRGGGVRGGGEEGDHLGEVHGAVHLVEHGLGLSAADVLAVGAEGSDQVGGGEKAVLVGVHDAEGLLELLDG